MNKSFDEEASKTPTEKEVRLLGSTPYAVLPVFEVTSRVEVRFWKADLTAGALQTSVACGKTGPRMGHGLKASAVVMAARATAAELKERCIAREKKEYARWRVLTR